MAGLAAKSCGFGSAGCPIRDVFTIREIYSACVDDVRTKIALSALASLPQAASGVVSRTQLLADAGGHAYDRGLHIGWAWGRDASLGIFLDLLWEHRMAGIVACRYWQDGSTEAIPTPFEFRVCSADPDEDARLEREYNERNRRLYADLRGRGLLPPIGENLGSQDLNEYLRTRSSSDGDASSPT